MRLNGMFLRVDLAEQRLCMLANAAARGRAARAIFQTVSRLGDGVFWYVLMGLMPLWRGLSGVAIALEMLAAGAVGLLLYKMLKNRLVRERPFIGLVGIECAMPPLDRYSFPSGHTLHAVTFTLIAIRYVPELAFVLVPFTMLVGASRVVLGLHYPSDVIAGAALGWGIATASGTLVS